jgi:hypothetical protein
MKRAKILAQITNFRSARALDQKSRTDRNLFAGSTVLFKGTAQNEPCCAQIEPPDTIPVVDVFCDATACYRHQ